MFLVALHAKAAYSTNFYTYRPPLNGSDWIFLKPFTEYTKHVCDIRRNMTSSSSDLLSLPVSLNYQKQKIRMWRPCSKPARCLSLSRQNFFILFFDNTWKLSQRIKKWSLLKYKQKCWSSVCNNLKDWMLSYGICVSHSLDSKSAWKGWIYVWRSFILFTD